ncbi:unnamed protein product, partial [Phaeothamnion confervicola]
SVDLHFPLTIAYPRKTTFSSESSDAVKGKQKFDITTAHKTSMIARTIALATFLGSCAAFYSPFRLLGQQRSPIGTLSMASKGGYGESAWAITRRSALLHSAAAVAVSTLSCWPGAAQATGLLDFPPKKLNNRYFLVRSAESVADANDLVQSHPIDKLAAANGLTDKGVRQVETAAAELEKMGVIGGATCFIWADLSSRAQQTAHLLAERLDVGQERVVPEFSFLEPRGLGALDGQKLSAVLPTVHASDKREGAAWRPPPNDDGTPHESAADVFVRVRQLMSKLETQQYFGEDIIIVSPDSDCLSVLQAYALGEDIADHARHFVRAGEARPLRVSDKTKTIV